MAKLSKFKTSIEAANKGIEVDMGDGLYVTVAREGNENYQRYLREALKPYSTQLNSKTPNPAFEKVFESILNQAQGEFILVGWKGMEDDDGTEISYSVDKSIEILSDPAYADFKEDILKIAKTQELYREEFVTQTKSQA